MALATRFHKKVGANLFQYLIANKRDFEVEKTSMGVPTIKLGTKSFYIRNKPATKGTLGKISQFQAHVKRSNLYDFVSQRSEEEIAQETDAISRSILYKGFNFAPEEKQIKGAYYVDLNSAYWHACRIMGLIDEEMFNEVNEKYRKTFRLKMVGTLGKKDRIIEYKNGQKTLCYRKPKKVHRLIYANLYERLRKFVDELMIWVYQQNPSNFIGYYVDCFWLREGDLDLLLKIEDLFHSKLFMCDLDILYNKHHSCSVAMRTQDTMKPYDVQFRRLQFENYEFLHNFDTPFTNLNFNAIWQT